MALTALARTRKLKTWYTCLHEGGIKRSHYLVVRARLEAFLQIMRLYVSCSLPRQSAEETQRLVTAKERLSLIEGTARGNTLSCTASFSSETGKAYQVQQ